MTERVVGLDVWKGKWVGVVLDGCRFETANVFGTLEDALARERASRVIAIDVPIGLPERGTREADVEARRFAERRNLVLRRNGARLHFISNYVRTELGGRGACAPSRARPAWRQLAIKFLDFTFGLVRRATENPAAVGFGDSSPSRCAKPFFNRGRPRHYQGMLGFEESLPGITANGAVQSRVGP